METKGGDQRHRCALCGRPGAMWIVKIGSHSQMAHKECGKTIAKSAPAGVFVKVYPSEKLRMEWQARRFWAEKFQKAGLDAATGRPVRSS
ncbi:hypothetical protein C4572_01750 [Candidatus Parcubacteria bacterium]|nr:MAG: hypothetical protein C4572_01750 [Candidatus Parcubacteria bacterium]